MIDAASGLRGSGCDFQRAQAQVGIVDIAHQHELVGFGGFGQCLEALLDAIRAADHADGKEVADGFALLDLAEARALRAMGLFGHVTTREMLVIGDDGRAVDQAWRFDDEPA